MKIQLSWLRELVDVELPLPELLDRLTMIGLVCETWAETGGDAVLDLETYANRPDTLGHLGVAREVAAMLGRPLREPARPLQEIPSPVEEAVAVQVLDEELCPRYCGMVVRDVKVGPSPDWLRRRIEAMGLNPINNVVDASNYVLFGTGQPIHTFDLGRISGPKVVVRRAKKGETLRTLAGREAALTPDMLVIADDKKPVAVAGVIGGLESGVTEATRDVFIESATFDPVSIRLTRKALDLNTDASYRYERGADIGFAPKGALLTAGLLAEFGGRACRGMFDLYPRPRKPKDIVLRARRVCDLLGAEVDEAFTVRILEALGFVLRDARDGVWLVQAPTHRVDVEREADLVEEVARFYGYDRIPSVLPPLEVVEPGPSERERLRRLGTRLLHHGFDEVVNASFADPERDAAFGAGPAPVAIRNPISSRAAILRTTLLGGLLENTAHNRNRGLDGVHIFEIGSVYGRLEPGVGEDLCLGLSTWGQSAPPHWKVKPAPTDFFRLKGAAEGALESLRYAPLASEPATHPAYEEGTALALLYKGERIGVLGRVRASILALYDLPGPVYAGEIRLAVLFGKSPRPFEYVPPPRFPAVVRDLSIVIGRDVPYRDVRAAVDKAAPAGLESCEVIDRYEGGAVPADRVSLGLRLVFRDPKGTLQAEEVDRAERRILKALKTAFGARLREGEKT